MESRGTPFLLHLQQVKQDYIIVPTLPFPVHSALPLTDLDHAPAQNHEHSPAEQPKQPIIFTSSRHLVFPGTFFAFLFFLPNDKRNLHLTHDFFPDLMQQGPPSTEMYCRAQKPKTTWTFPLFLHKKKNWSHYRHHFQEKTEQRCRRFTLLSRVYFERSFYWWKHSSKVTGLHMSSWGQFKSLNKCNFIFWEYSHRHLRCSMNFDKHRFWITQ